MGIGTQASGALVLATAPQRRVWQERSRAREARVWYGACGQWRDSAKWCLGYFTLLKQCWDFYPFSTSLLISVLLLFYVKTAELLHYPHPMSITHRYVG